MREIRFRGKRVDSGEWVFGDLVQLNDGRRFIVDNKFGACIDGNGNFINTEAPFVNKVNPETVGQFTGIKDKDKNGIYDGDIVKLCDTNPVIYVVKTILARYGYKVMFYYADDAKPANGCFLDRCEVIGNIWDNADGINPELLK